MPDISKEESLFDGQIDVRFKGKKHQYFRRVNTDDGIVRYVDVPSEEEKEIPLVSKGTKTEWVKIQSTTSVTGKCLDKPELYNWFTDVAVNMFKKCIEKGMSIEEAEGKAKGARWKRLKEGGDTGTEVHNWINQFILSMMGNGEDPEPNFSNKEVERCIEGFLGWYDEYVKEPLQTEYIVYHPEVDIAGTLDFIFTNKEGELEVVDFKTGKGIYPGDVMQLAFYRKAYALRHGDFPDVASIIHLQKDSGKAVPLRSLNHDMNLVAFEAGHYLVTWRDTLKV